MSFNFLSKSIKRLLLSMSTFSLVIFSSVPAWAEGTGPVPGEDATQNVVRAETQTPWFYWPGWAFLGLTLLVLAVMAYSWYKLIFIPKYRGTKVSQ